VEKNFCLITGDCLEELRKLPDQSVHTCITSPPYWALRDYGIDGQIGLEATMAEYVQNLVSVFREVRRVLRIDGTLWLNAGDSFVSRPRSANSNQGLVGRRGERDMPGSIYVEKKGRPKRIKSIGSKEKNLLGIPWRIAFALQEDGWCLRTDIVWAKTNPFPESVRDRPTRSHEFIFLFSKSSKYYYDSEAIKEPCVNGEGMKNRRSVWTIPTHPYKDAHFATFPPSLVEPCILAGCPTGGVVLDCFSGAATTGLVANQWGRKYVGIELSAAYNEMAERRLLECDFSSSKNPLVSTVTISQ